MVMELVRGESTTLAASVEPTAMPKGFGPNVKRESMTLTLRQRHHIDRLTARYNARTMGSQLHTQRHRPHHAEIGRAHVCTPVTNAPLVCRLLLEKKHIHTT